jgi:Na+/H+ antiporter NhaC
MKPARHFVAAAAFLATFAWLTIPDIKSSPAVLWPSVLAVGLAFVTRDIYLSLFLGAASGALLLHHGNPWPAFQDLFRVRLIPSLTDRWNISVIVFTVMIGGLVELLNRNGGMTALATRVVAGSTNPRRAGLSAYFLGWLLFIDGLASSLLVGRTMRTISDRAGLSREKLAFIVDSTSSPIAGLALLSTWIAYEISVIREGLENTGDPLLVQTAAPYQWLVLSLPFRFYNWFVLLLVFLVVWLARDWGPMLSAEQASRARSRSGPGPLHAAPQGSHAVLAVVPILVLIFGVFVGLYVSGGGLEQPPTFRALSQAIGNADTAGVFILATAVAMVAALLLTAVWNSRSTATTNASERPTHAILDGMHQMFLPALILVLAWVLNSVIKELGTASYLAGFLRDRLSPAWLPSMTFLLAAVVSFSTGTSWGTMAVLMPLAIPVATSLTGVVPAQPFQPALVATIGAVLAGAVFGDHCSPISDTTVVSAFSTGCDVVSHVRTQLPYALAAALLAIFVGYLPAGFGIGPVWLLALGATLCWGLVRFVGTKNDS